MIIYQRSAGASLSFGVQVIFQTRMTRMTWILFSPDLMRYLNRKTG